MFDAGPMRAIMATRFGAPDVLEAVDLPTPAPAPGEIRIAVEVVNVTWMDTLIRAGDGPAVFAVDPPYVPGSGVAGTVEAIGGRRRQRLARNPGAGQGR
jgi:NADPH2:quinone reductase